MMVTEDQERDIAHAELALERWEAHREKHAGEKELAEQKWEAHAQQHESIARNLAEYKSQSNEWRGSLSDLRATFAARSELESLEGRVTAFREELRTMIATEREERREQQATRSGRTAAGVDTRTLMFSLIAAGGTILAIVSFIQFAMR